MHDNCTNALDKHVLKDRLYSIISSDIVEAKSLRTARIEFDETHGAV